MTEPWDTVFDQVRQAEESVKAIRELVGHRPLTSDSRLAQIERHANSALAHLKSAKYHGGRDDEG
jgi:hypothetical protein